MLDSLNWEHERIVAENTKLRSDRARLVEALRELVQKHTLGNRAGSMSMDATRLDPYILPIRALLAELGE